MRQHLLDHLTSKLESYVKFRAADPLALYIHVPKSPLTYPELEESVFSTPFYIQNLLDNERFLNYQINDPNGFLNSLMQDLRRSAKILANLGAETSIVRKEVPRTHLLFHALAHLVDRSSCDITAVCETHQHILRINAAAGAVGHAVWRRATPCCRFSTSRCRARGSSITKTPRACIATATTGIVSSAGRNF